MGKDDLAVAIPFPSSDDGGEAPVEVALALGVYWYHTIAEAKASSFFQASASYRREGLVVAVLRSSREVLLYDGNSYYERVL